MYKAKYFVKNNNKQVLCKLCPHMCLIENGFRGLCKVRKNIKGTLYSLNHSKPCSIAVDPIEKKPLNHFLPNTQILSMGTFGCNFKCLNCQNYDISQEFEDIEKINQKIEKITPNKIVKIAKKNKIPSIAFTYNEPTTFFEYMLDTAILAQKEEVKTVVVSNGYINENPLKELLPHIDAINIDLKSFNENTYQKITGGKLKPILNNLKKISNTKTHLEITRLVIPSYSDDIKEFEEMCSWIKKKLGDVPLHISRFFPLYRLTHLESTPKQKMYDFEKIAKKYLTKVHLGNMH